ncbi:MAG: 2-hydroxyacyl-CoA dehydratase family protein [Pseudomonadota bacterium]|jgi:benzoyl-CoA reductase/2-hydroxyglutaryl-CoA dehydratase subunit BcrC/BadD/HgdB|nr:2-hydroxyacyl-CoA dehydratase family protein [Pseudomonadota bacterium]
MSMLTQLLQGTATDPLRHARLHAERDGVVIGLVGYDTPVELVLAADALPVQLPAFADRATPEADRYLEASFTPMLRSIVDEWLRGRFDFMRAVIFSRSDDSAQRCYYYLCELQRCGLAGGPTPLIFDVAKIPRATSRAHTQASLRTMAEALSSDPAKLAEAIATRNRRRTLLSRLELARHSARPPVGSDCERLLRLADAVPADRLDRELAAWLAGDFPPHQGPRLLLAGSVPPDGRLHEAVERAGGCVVAEVDDRGLDGRGPISVHGPDPLPVLARHHHELDCGARSFGDRVALLARRVSEARADGAVVWLIEEDEASVWQLPAMAAALAAARVPLLSMTRRRWDARDGTLEQIEAFVRRLQVAR